jgi:hypothetical protein
LSPNLWACHWICNLPQSRSLVEFKLTFQIWKCFVGNTLGTPIWPPWPLTRDQGLWVAENTFLWVWMTFLKLWECSGRDYISAKGLSDDSRTIPCAALPSVDLCINMRQSLHKYYLLFTFKSVSDCQKLVQKRFRLWLLLQNKAELRLHVRQGVWAR